MSNLLKIIVVGATGRMGQAIVNEIYNDSNLQLFGAIDLDSCQRIGKDVGELMGIFTNVVISSDLNSIIKDCDILIDFTRPEASLKYLLLCVDNNISYVLGTTGFSDLEKHKIVEASKKIPICFSPNMSIGINLLISLVEQATKTLHHDYDVEIIEAHHRHKVDAPSGTALRLGESVAKVSGRTLKDNGTFHREGNMVERRSDEIGFSTIRGGDIIGDHTVLFAGDGERVELTHKASNRSTFSKGAIRAAKFLSKQSSGLFDMFDVLELKK